jgi:hypothetical protein
MKDYKMINEAIVVAEELLAQEKQHYISCVCNAEWEVKYQICDYIYNLLRNVGFPHIFGIRVENYKPPIESYMVSFSSGDYGCDGKRFGYQLFIRDCLTDKVSRIFFNEEDYYEDTMQHIQEDTLLVLIKVWHELKTTLSEAINNAYQARIKAIKKEVDEIKRKQEILKGFKL